MGHYSNVSAKNEDFVTGQKKGLMDTPFTKFAIFE